jgi:hypothetical protein
LTAIGVLEQYKDLKITGVVKDSNYNELDNKTIVLLKSGNLVEINTKLKITPNTEIRYYNDSKRGGYEHLDDVNIYNIYTVFCVTSKNIFNIDKIVCNQGIRKVVKTK